MPGLFINGQPVQAARDQTVMQAAQANGFYIPYFCWHPHLSVHGNCRVCVVEVESEHGNWVDIACNMPVTEGMRVLTDSEAVRKRRRQTLEFITLNHPVDCGICDKAGECTLQDYHYAYNGQPSRSRDAKVRASKFFPLSERIVLDNERCILCSRCVRFTREISKSDALGIQNRGDRSLVRAAEDGRFDRDPYSDNVVDICPVGALLSKAFLYQSRVWYLQATPSVCPGCSRGCAIDVWHRKPEWKLNALDPRRNTRIERVTPRDNPAVNGPWVCNKARDLPRILGRPRALEPLLEGRPASLDEALARARRLIGEARNPVAMLSSWGSNEELAAFAAALGARFTGFVKADHLPADEEPLEDGILIRADKNPNTAGALGMFPGWSADGGQRLAAATDLVLVWGEGFDFGRVPPGARTILLGSWLAPENGHADVFVPISIQTERSGHYTNFQGTVSAFAACFAKPSSVVDAEALFTALAVEVESA
jgi:NADH-quinone oxidoreductase subunit G